MTISFLYDLEKKKIGMEATMVSLSVEMRWDKNFISIRYENMKEMKMIWDSQTGSHPNNTLHVKN